MGVEVGVQLKPLQEERLWATEVCCVAENILYTLLPNSLFIGIILGAWNWPNGNIYTLETRKQHKLGLLCWVGGAASESQLTVY